METRQKAKQRDDQENGDVDILGDVSFDPVNIVNDRNEHDADNQRLIADAPMTVTFKGQMETAQVTTENAEADTAQI